jgi:octaheme c-type cytochrome (tetrathionate reductase family)
MKNRNLIWLGGLGATLALLIIPVLVFLPRVRAASDDPQSYLPVRDPPTDHSALMPGPYETGSQVTQRCLECHPDAAEQVMGTVHWTWQDEPVPLPGRDELVALGKKNAINNFCIGIQSNWPGCTSCHAGYGWEDADFDFSDSTAVDCLICHDTSGAYGKGDAGYPLEGSDLAAAAQSVSYPTRDNCGTCHFSGGGGNAVKHGDLDMHLIFPAESLDVHMGGADFQCIDCHRTEDHDIKGKSISVSIELDDQVFCTDCHATDLHGDQRLTGHLDSVACQTCHLPEAAVDEPTKMFWDWSTAGQDLPESTHTYLKIKGSFVYEQEIIPEYLWYSGLCDRYLFGDVIDPNTVTPLNPICGDINDSAAKLSPFKIHRARQPYDTVYNILLQPKTVGEGGFWTDFDWDQALRLGSEVVGLPYSGEYSFAETIMYWPLAHMIAPAADALQCNDCHGSDGRLDWIALGYPGDPIEWGGRFSTGRQP